MQYQVYRDNNIMKLEEQKLFNLIRLLSLFVLTSTIGVVMDFFPQSFSLINSFLCIIIIALCYKAYGNIDNDLLLKVDGTCVVYFSNEEAKLISIQAEEISKITTAFCQLQVHTRDNNIHLINMEPIKKEKTRWEVKEMIKQLAKQQPQSFSVAS